MTKPQASSRGEAKDSALLSSRDAGLLDGLENAMDRGAWWATVHGIAKSQTRLSDSVFVASCGNFTASQLLAPW